MLSGSIPMVRVPSSGGRPGTRFRPACTYKLEIPDSPFGAPFDAGSPPSPRSARKTANGFTAHRATSRPASATSSGDLTRGGQSRRQTFGTHTKRRETTFDRLAVKHRAV